MHAMNLRQLEIFLAVARHGSFTAAAEKLPFRTIAAKAIMATALLTSTLLLLIGRFYPHSVRYCQQ